MTEPKLLCILFGHRSLEDTYSGADYVTVERGPVDGIGREHAVLYGRCPRCDRKYRVGRLHLYNGLIE